MNRAIAIVLLFCLAAGAKPRELQVPWSQLDRELARSRVMVATGKQPVIQGEYLGLQGEEGPPPPLASG